MDERPGAADHSACPCAAMTATAVILFPGEFHDCIGGFNRQKADLENVWERIPRPKGEGAAKRRVRGTA
jgi:hypothetical protein